MGRNTTASPGDLAPPDANLFYDVIVLGVGPGGQIVADRAWAAGLSVAVVERELVGGESSYRGCIPSKAPLRRVIAVAEARRIEGAREVYNESIGTVGVFGHRDRYETAGDNVRIVWKPPRALSNTGA